MIVHLNFPLAMNRPPVEMKRSLLLVGRHPECDVRLKLGSVSRRHCCLAQVNDDVHVRDLGSRHGVWVNGRRVEQTILKPGDELAIGSVILTVAASEPFEPNPPPPAPSEELMDLDAPPGPLARSADDELMDLDAPLVMNDPEEAGENAPSGDESEIDLLDESGVGPGLGIKL